MSRIAVIGSGISGLSAAYYLSRRHEVTLFEKDSRIGGHTHTVTVQDSRGPVRVDTGFIVHNDRTYPNLVRLFAELGVGVQPSDMSFAVTCRKTGFEYSSRGLPGFFAQPVNLVRPSHYELLREILRFNREAPHLLDMAPAPEMSLGEYLAERRYRQVFIERYLQPMASAIWSASPAAIMEFPALTLVRFFDNHGMLGISTHPKWKVVQGGSSSYLEPITAPYRGRILTAAAIRSVSRDPASVSLHFVDRPPLAFDEVVFACHGDQVLPILESPTDAERELLGAFRTSRNETVLHTDTALLPRRRGAWASWNYNLPAAEGESATVTYHMNRLQSLDTREQYCVTLNGTAMIDRSRILRELVYEHPQYTRETIRAQARWGEISGRLRTHYCGAYWFYGFHEDGLNSALRVARSLGVHC